MKRTLLTFIATAGMLLLGGVSAKADDGSWTITVAPSTGTFYRDSDGNTSSSVWRDRWVSNDSPTITVADADGSTTNNMTFDNTLDGITLAEGSGSSSYGYTVSVEYGYLISGMTVTVQTNADDMTVTIGSETVTSDESPKTVTLSDVGTQSVTITVSSSGGTNETATLYNWTVTVVEDPDAKDFSVDLSHMKITAISDAITSQPEEGKWYLMKNDRHGDNGAYGDWSPVYDNGEGNTMMRAANDNVVQVGDMAEDVAQYLLRFFTTDATSTLAKSVVVNPQWATGNFWTSTLTTTSDFGSAGSYNMYLTADGGDTFAFNLYDMGDIVDNNGAGKDLAFWEKGEVTATSSGANNIWWLYSLELEQAEDAEVEEREHEVTLEALIEEAQAAYEANEIYDTDIDFGFSEGDGVGNGIIQTTEQFSSPYTETSEGSLDNLLDNDASMFWHSAWSGGSVANGTHYIEVDLSEEYLSGQDAFTGGPLLVNILRRSIDSDQVLKMSVKDGNDIRIADLDLPNEGGGTRVVAGFTCPENVYTLRFYEESTSSGSGYFHLGDFQLFYTTDTGSPNYGVQEAEDLAAAIAKALATLDAALDGSGSVSENDIAALQAALDAYNAVFAAHNELAAELLEAIEEAYDAYEANCGYEDLVLESAGENLIKSADQLSSPYSQTDGELGNLIDNDISTSWNSYWGGGNVDNGVHYIQVELPEDFDGGEIQVYIERRNNTYNNHITEMSVKGIVSDEYGREATYRIALLELPYAFHYEEGEEEYAGFTCPAGVKTLRFYEEATAGVDQYNVGFWHLAEFHLYASSLTDDCGNATLKAMNDKNKTLLAAISTALDKYDTCTEDDIATLKAATSTYLHEDISWTLGADYGTLILPFNEAVSADELTVYPCTGVSDSEVQLGDAVSAIAPKTPYIVSGTAGGFTFSGDASFKTSLYTEGLLTGTLTSTTAPTGSYVLQNQTGTPAFYLVDGTSTITVGNYHCYLTLADESGDEGSGVKAEVISFPGSGTATAIEAVESAAEAGDGAIYDLSGRKVAKAQKGIYIVNGKKVVIK